MSIDTLVLYGSGARGDGNMHSDLDLFAIVKEHSQYSMVVRDRVNLATYSLTRAAEMAASGDLFMLHIVKEGKVLYDYCGYHENLCRAFVYKDDYTEVVRHGSDLGWALLQVIDEAVDHSLVNKRIAWCIRTILIALTAAARTPKFSAAALAAQFPDAHVEELINNKSNEVIDLTMSSKFENFLRKFGFPKPRWMDGLTAAKIGAKMEKERNFVGSKTMRVIDNSSMNLLY